MQQIYQQVWINLPKEIRLQLIKDFGLERTGVTEVRDQTLISDGFTNDDLKCISLEKMCEYIGSEETFIRAWEITLAKVHAILNPPIAIIQNVNGEPTAVDIEEIPVTEERFCTLCASKGGKHYKGCPNGKLDENKNTTQE